VGILYGFAPWIVYWVLVGNVPFTTAVLIALAIAIVMYVLGRRTHAPGHTLQIGALVTFLVLTALTLTVSQAFMERWMQPLSNVGIFAVALAGVLAGRPFVREFAAVGQPPEVVDSDLFGTITNRLTWIWVAVFAGMTISSAIPPIVQGDATILDIRTPLSFVFYWVIPFTLLGLGALASRILPDKMTISPDVVRKTTFVAYSEATIDELYYLAREHAGREVGGGQEAFDIKVGGAGTPLVGDESRMSWPSTYKVRERKQ
jgi:hypothetical protein